ncbi:hypothetical protein [Clostridium guangxiense]|uniref:hypothetical protein n=1 Tax=Clostridium guangxiense TaxID=1662055 RepID=UPI001E4FEAA6|nr:hypothetical protein [Clostridium guangxiense]MCD2346362.1 hypothetical protein [Clostridium guangxiense]
MKKVTKVIIWVLISLAIQSVVLLYFNNFYTRDKKITYKRIDVPSEKKTNVKADIPYDARNIEASSTGKFVSYYLKNSIHVITMKDNKDNVIKLNVPIENVSINWMSSDDKLMVIERKNADIKVSTYDPKETKENKLIKNLDVNNEWKSYPINSNYKITGIQQNNKNTLIYLKITENGSKNYSFLKKLDISTGIKKMDLPIHNIGNYYIFKAENVVVFEDEVDKKIYAAHEVKKDVWRTQPLQIQGVTGLKLLYVDDNGIVYVGKFVNGKINAIYTCDISTGKAEGSSNKITAVKGNWNKITLKTKVDSKHIYVSDLGDIYTVDNEKGIILNIKTGKRFSFKGTYVCMFGDSTGGGIISLSDGKIIETVI